jgi:hypothetical protein
MWLEGVCCAPTSLSFTRIFVMDHKVRRRSDEGRKRRHLKAE